MYESVLNPDKEADIPISQESHALAILHKPEGEKNSEHTFLMLEGMVDNMVRLVKIDPVQSRENPGKIIFHIREKTVSPDEAYTTLNDEFLDGEKVFGKCWPIYRYDAERLERIIARMNKKPGNYNLLGRNAIASELTAGSHTQSAVITSGSLFGRSGREIASAIATNPGDNCWTGLREALKKLAVKHIQLPESKDELVLAIPSLRLRDQSLYQGAIGYTRNKFKRNEEKQCDEKEQTGSSCRIL